MAQPVLMSADGWFAKLGSLVFIARPAVAFETLQPRCIADSKQRRIIIAAAIAVGEMVLVVIVTLGYFADVNSAAAHTQFPLWHICHAFVR
ncbi:MAG: hypothetical protein HY243_08260 [Proteobacteria bacterium]|nr:hypothetical protein [Pseudomonadota bacterium]